MCFILWYRFPWSKRSTEIQQKFLPQQKPHSCLFNSYLFKSQNVSGVHLNFSSKYVLKSRLWTHHSCKKRKIQTADLWSVIRSAFTIDTSMPTLTGYLNEHPILTKMNFKGNLYLSYYKFFSLLLLDRFSYFSLNKNKPYMIISLMKPTADQDILGSKPPTWIILLITFSFLLIGSNSRNIFQLREMRSCSCRHCEWPFYVQ
jgi:hypothetical protein